MILLRGRLTFISLPRTVETDRGTRGNRRAGADENHRRVGDSFRGGNMNNNEKLLKIAEKMTKEAERKKKVKADKVKPFDKMSTTEKINYIAAYLGID
jgi:hypothetical protein